ncbi:MAG: STAS domain-containing protein [Anaerolineae bacterium]|nr:STAS domain-containing protein [Phycisphaerae bacterium]
MPDFYRIESSERAQVIELTLPQMLDSAEFDELNEAILSTISERKSERWVIDLGQVSYMGSAMLGLMVNLRQQIKSAGGKLVLCSMPPSLMQIFRTCCMERLFVIAKTRDEAFRSA